MAKIWKDDYDYAAAMKTETDPEKLKQLETERNAKVDWLKGEGSQYAVDNNLTGGSLNKSYNYNSNPDVMNNYNDATTATFTPTTTIGNPSGHQFDQAAPTFSSQYGTQIDDLLNEILNREDFSYNYEDDPLYKQYAETFTREGNRAMNDTLAATAANTGGLASSYSVGAANQANNAFMSQLSDKIPELEQLAYAKYMDDYARQTNNLGLLQGQDDRDYGRYRDSYGEWFNERGFDYGKYTDQINRDITVDQNEYNRFKDQRDWSYGVGRDQMQDEKDAEQTEYDRGQDEYQKALDRSITFGSVSKDDAAILNLKEGTLTSDQAFRDAELKVSQQNANTNSSQETRMQSEANRNAALNRFVSSGVLSAEDADILGFPPSAVGMPYPGKGKTSTAPTSPVETAYEAAIRAATTGATTGAVSTMPVGNDKQRDIDKRFEDMQAEYYNDVYGENGEVKGVIIDGTPYTWHDILLDQDSENPQLIEVVRPDGKIEYKKK